MKKSKQTKNKVLIYLFINPKMRKKNDENPVTCKRRDHDKLIHTFSVFRLFLVF